jgi:predicted nucleotidyltransferase
MTEIQRQAQQAREALRRAVAKALDQKRRLGQYAVICRNGKPMRIEPEQLPGRETMKRDEVIHYLRRFKEMNKDKYQIVRLGLFGSAARDSMTESSDIDVVVELTTPDMFMLIGIKQELEEQLHCPVDIVRYRDTMNAFLKSRIDQDALYV